MKFLASLPIVLALSLASIPALADALPPDPCEGKAQGDACTDLSNKAGKCQPGTMCMPSPCLVCDTSTTSSSSSSSGGTTTSSSSSGGTTTSSSSSGGGTETDGGGGCSLHAGAGASGALVAAVLGLLGVAASARRKRR